MVKWEKKIGIFIIVLFMALLLSPAAVSADEAVATTNGAASKTLIMLDNSWSIPSLEYGMINDFISSICDAGDELDQYALATYGTEFRMLVDFTTDIDSIRKAASEIEYTDQETSLSNIWYELATRNETIAESDTPVQIIAISDGVDNMPKELSAEEIKALPDCPVYAIGVNDNKQTNEESLQAMKQFAESTGGAYAFLDDKSASDVSDSVNTFVQSRGVEMAGNTEEAENSETADDAETTEKAEVVGNAGATNNADDSNASENPKAAQEVDTAETADDAVVEEETEPAANAEALNDSDDSNVSEVAEEAPLFDKSIFLWIGLAVVAVVICVALLALRKRTNSDQKKGESVEWNLKIDPEKLRNSSAQETESQEVESQEAESQITESQITESQETDSQEKE